MAKKKNSRKALAVALGIMGIAGLSVASASSLNLSAGNEVGIGVDTFANCQDDASITVDYTYNSSMVVTEITFDGIAAACEGNDMSFTLAYTEGDGTTAVAASPFTSAAHTLLATEVGAENSYTVLTPTTPAASVIPVSYDLGDVTVIIK